MDDLFGFVCMLLSIIYDLHNCTDCQVQGAHLAEYSKVSGYEALGTSAPVL